MAYFKVLAKNTDPKTFFALKTVGKKFIVFSDQPLEKTGTFYPIFQKNISPSKKFFKAHLALLNDRVGLEEQQKNGEKFFRKFFGSQKFFLVFSSLSRKFFYRDGNNPPILISKILEKIQGNNLN